MNENSPIMSDSSGSASISYVGAVVGGIIGAGIGGAIWAGVAVLFDVEIGFLAILVGALVGGGVVLGAGQRRGMPYQLISVVIAALGILIGKYITIYHFFRLEVINQFGEASWNELGFSVLSGEYFQLFVEILPETFEILDIVFFGIAIYTAFGIPKARPEAVPVKPKNEEFIESS